MSTRPAVIAREAQFAAGYRPTLIDIAWPALLLLAGVVVSGYVSFVVKEDAWSWSLTWLDWCAPAAVVAATVWGFWSWWHKKSEIKRGEAWLSLTTTALEARWEKEKDRLSDIEREFAEKAFKSRIRDFEVRDGYAHDGHLGEVELSCRWEPDIKERGVLSLVLHRTAGGAQTNILQVRHSGPPLLHFDEAPTVRTEKRSKDRGTPNVIRYDPDTPDKKTYTYYLWAEAIIRGTPVILHVHKKTHVVRHREAYEKYVARGERIVAAKEQDRINQERRERMRNPEPVEETEPELPPGEKLVRHLQKVAAIGATLKTMEQDKEEFLETQPPELRDALSAEADKVIEKLVADM